jgi:hypothetical protein
MSSEKLPVERSGVVLSIVALAGLASLALGGVAVDSQVSTQRTGLREASLAATLPERLAAVDAAITRRDAGRAAYEWREAYGLALGARRWEPMIEVGDAAVRIDALASRPSGHPTGFRAEARQAYLRALFQARAQRSPEGIERAAQAFAALGDVEMAARARAITVSR